MYMCVYTYIYIYIYICLICRSCASSGSLAGSALPAALSPALLIDGTPRFARTCDTGISEKRNILLQIQVCSNLRYGQFSQFQVANFKLSVSNPKNKYVAYLSVLSRISDCQGPGRKSKHEILKTDRTGISYNESGGASYGGCPLHSPGVLFSHIYIYIYICIV